jgi:hypothetical protein
MMPNLKNWEEKVRTEFRQKRDTSFCSNLDTVLQQKDNLDEKIRVARTLKLAALFSTNIVLSDTQFIDNLGLRALFLNEPDFRDFAYSSAPDGLPPLLVGMRAEARNLRDVLADMIDVARKKKGPMLFSSFSRHQQQNLEEFHRKGEISLEAFYSIAGRRFEEYLEHTLTDIYCEKGKVYADYDLRINYPELVKKQIQGIDNFFLNSVRRGFINIIHCIESWEGDMPPTRTDLYREVEKLDVTPQVMREIKRVALDVPYNVNFVFGYQVNLLTERELSPSLLRHTAPNLLHDIVRTVDNQTAFTPITLIQKPKTTLFLDEMDFGMIRKIREAPDWAKNIRQISQTKDFIEMRKALATHIEFLLEQVEKSFRDRKDKQHLLYRDDLGSVAAKIGLPVSGGFGIGVGVATLLGLTSLVGGLGIAGGLTVLISGLVLLRPPLTKEFKQFKSEFGQIKTIYS